MRSQPGRTGFQVGLRQHLRAPVYIGRREDVAQAAEFLNGSS